MRFLCFSFPLLFGRRNLLYACFGVYYISGRSVFEGKEEEDEM